MRVGVTVFSMVFGLSRVVAIKKLGLLVCPFPDPLARESKLCWDICLVCAFRCFWVDSSKSRKREAKHNPGNLPSWCPLNLRSLGGLPFFLHLSESFYVCFNNNAKVLAVVSGRNWESTSTSSSWNWKFPPVSCVLWICRFLAFIFPAQAFSQPLLQGTLVFPLENDI